MGCGPSSKKAVKTKESNSNTQDNQPQSSQASGASAAVNNNSANTSEIRSRHITCAEQDVTFNLIYVLAVVLNGVSSFLNGALWDKFGTTFMRVIGM